MTLLGIKRLFEKMFGPSDQPLINDINNIVNSVHLHYGTIDEIIIETTNDASKCNIIDRLAMIFTCTIDTNGKYTWNNVPFLDEHETQIVSCLHKLNIRLRTLHELFDNDTSFTGILRQMETQRTQLQTANQIVTKCHSFLDKYCPYIFVVKFLANVDHAFGNNLTNPIPIALKNNIIQKIYKNQDVYRQFTTVRYVEELEEYMSILLDGLAEIRQEHKLKNIHDRVMVTCNMLSAKIQTMSASIQYKKELKMKIPLVNEYLHKKEMEKIAAGQLELQRTQIYHQGIVAEAERDMAKAEQHKAKAEQSKAEAEQQLATAEIARANTERSRLGDERWRNGEYISWFFT